MKPIFKYSGGKSREAPRLASMVPSGISRIVEPFGGGAALSFHLEKPALIGDLRRDAMLCFKVVKDPTLYPRLQKMVNKLKGVQGKFELEPIFYRWRDQKWGSSDPVERAFRWIVLRQLVFSGIDRVAKSGKENGPFGWYKSFSCSLSIKHHELLQSWDIYTQPFEATLDKCENGDFIFLDPPYLDRNSTYGGPGTDERMHTTLLEMLETISLPWLLVHCEHPLYSDFATRYNSTEAPFAYSQNFKGRDNTNQKTKHLYICNFDLLDPPQSQE